MKSSFLNQLFIILFVSISLVSCDVDDKGMPLQVFEKAVLNETLEEIFELANSVPCTDSSNWDYTAYGAKACGGPQGYLAYSKQMNDVIAFLKKVDEYSKAEKAFNMKWGVASTCDLILAPSSVECENGVPVFKY